MSPEEAALYDQGYEHGYSKGKADALHVLFEPTTLRGSLENLAGLVERLNKAVVRAELVSARIDNYIDRYNT